MDPVHGVSLFYLPSRGDRFVATVFLVTDLTNVPTDDAGADISVIGSNHHAYSAGDEPVSECTNFYTPTGLAQLPVDLGSTTGCTVFELPVGVKVVRVEWSADEGEGEWTV
jgi:hypothetical protein